MLLNLHKKSWVEGLKLEDYKTHETNNENTMKEMLELAKNYSKSIEANILLILGFGVAFILFIIAVLKKNY